MALHKTRCLGCGQLDDHPKHVIGTADGNAVSWHMDCHAASENGCESCSAQKEGAEDLRGDAFRAYIQGLGDDFHAELQQRVNADAVAAAEGGE